MVPPFLFGFLREPKLAWLHPKALCGLFELVALHTQENWMLTTGKLLQFYYLIKLLNSDRDFTLCDRAGSVHQVLMLQRS